MKKLYNNENLVNDIKKMKLKCNLETGSVFLLLGIEIVIAILNNVGFISEHIFDYFSIFNLVLVVGGVGGSRVNARKRKFLTKLSDDIEKITKENCIIYKAEDLIIVPRNIQIGEDLSNSNIVPIFKEGHYIIVKSRPASFVLQQVEQNEKESVDILDSIDANKIVEELALEDSRVNKNKVLLLRGRDS